jgi:hypothetical protein
MHAPSLYILYLLIEVFDRVLPKDRILEIRLRPFASPDKVLAINGDPFVGKTADGDLFVRFSRLGTGVNAGFVNVFVMQDPMARTPKSREVYQSSPDI